MDGRKFFKIFNSEEQTFFGSDSGSDVEKARTDSGSQQHSTTHQAQTPQSASATNPTQTSNVPNCSQARSAAGNAQDKASSTGSGFPPGQGWMRIVKPTRTIRPASPTRLAPRTRSTTNLMQRGAAYSQREDDQLVRRVFREPYGYMDAVNLGMWMDAEMDDVCPGRTAASMHERWRRHVLPQLHRFALNMEEIATVRNFHAASAAERKLLLQKAGKAMSSTDHGARFTRREDRAIQEFMAGFSSNDMIRWSEAVKRNICPGRSHYAMYLRSRKMKVGKGHAKNNVEILSDSEKEDDPIVPLTSRAASGAGRSEAKPDKPNKPAVFTTTVPTFKPSARRKWLRIGESDEDIEGDDDDDVVPRPRSPIEPRLSASDSDEDMFGNVEPRRGRLTASVAPRGEVSRTRLASYDPTPGPSAARTETTHVPCCDVRDVGESESELSTPGLSQILIEKALLALGKAPCSKRDLKTLMTRFLPIVLLERLDETQLQSSSSGSATDNAMSNQQSPRNRRGRPPRKRRASIVERDSPVRTSRSGTHLTPVKTKPVETSGRPPTEALPRGNESSGTVSPVLAMRRKKRSQSEGDVGGKFSCSPVHRRLRSKTPQKTRSMSQRTRCALPSEESKIAKKPSWSQVARSEKAGSSVKKQDSDSNDKSSADPPRRGKKRQGSKSPEYIRTVRSRHVINSSMVGPKKKSAGKPSNKSTESQVIGAANAAIKDFAAALSLERIVTATAASVEGDEFYSCSSAGQTDEPADSNKTDGLVLVAQARLDDLVRDMDSFMSDSSASFTEEEAQECLYEIERVNRVLAAITTLVQILKRRRQNK